MDGKPIELLESERTPCEVWTRVMGYHRPVSAFNAGKKAEHADRRYFVEPDAGDCNLMPPPAMTADCQALTV